MKFAIRPPSHSRSTFRAFIMHDGVSIGLIAVALMLGTYALLDLPLRVPLLILGFCGAVLVYQLDRVLGFSPEDRVNRPGRRQWVRAHRRYIRATIIGVGVVGGSVALMLRPATLAAGAGLGLVGIMHVWPVLRGGRRLKAWGAVKPVTISGAWALGAVLLPVIEAGHMITRGVLALIGYRFALVLVNTLLSDLGDRGGDVRAGLHTLATNWPASWLLRTAYLTLGISLLGGAWAVHWGAASRLLLVDLVAVLLMGGVVQRVHTDRAWARHIVVDAVVAWPVVTFLVGRLMERG